MSNLKFSKTTLEMLQALTEKDLVLDIIIPLLKKLGFESVEYRQGVYERGVDVSCLGRDEIGDEELLAVQVKKLRFSGKINESSNLYRVLDQLCQAKEEEIKLRNGTLRRPNRVWLISPFENPNSALEVAFSRYRKSVESGFKIVDGIRLVQLISKYAPELFAKLGDQESLYRIRIQNEIPVMREASAFRLSDKVMLSPIYINLDSSVLPRALLLTLNDCVSPNSISQHQIEVQIEKRGGVPLVNDAIKRVNDEFDEIDSFARQVESFFGVRIFERPSELSKIGREDLSHEERIVAEYRLDWAKFNRAAKRKTNSEFSRLKKVKFKGKDHLNQFFSFVSEVNALYQNPIALRNLRPNKTLTQHLIRRVPLSIENILDSDLNFQIVGDAGAGKSTMLRMLAFECVIGNNGMLPIYVPLSGLAPRQRVLDLLSKACLREGLITIESEISDLFRNGRFLILLDGLDETAHQSKRVIEEVESLLESTPNLRCIVASRGWSAVRRQNSRFASIYLMPFTTSQVKEFFRRWFRSDIEKANQLIDHLDKNPELYEVVSTPLVATIFAAVKQFGLQVPRSLLEVYKRRFELLLHGWDESKGLVRNEFDPEDKMFFAKKLAFHLHLSYRRTIDWNSMLKFAQSTVGMCGVGEEGRIRAERLLKELLNVNNIIEKHPDDKWGFGHLQYQEYLAALEAKENRAIQIDKFVEDNWWYSVLRFYAQMTRDVSDLIKAVDKKSRERGEYPLNVYLLHRLNELISHAPNTARDARQIVGRELEYAEAIDLSFSNTGDAEFFVRDSCEEEEFY